MMSRVYHDIFRTLNVKAEEATSRDCKERAIVGVGSPFGANIVAHTR
jgi:hypothetical protein